MILEINLLSDERCLLTWSYKPVDLLIYFNFAIAIYEAGFSIPVHCAILKWGYSVFVGVQAMTSSAGSRLENPRMFLTKSF